MKFLLRLWTAIARLDPFDRCRWRLAALFFALGVLPLAWGQLSPQKVSQIKIEHKGPASVSDDLIRANIRVNLDEQAGRPTATFEISDSTKIKIVKVEFPDAKAFSARKLRKVVKTRRHWMFSWLTRSGFLKDDVLEEDKEKLAEYYRDHGYID